MEADLDKSRDPYKAISDILSDLDLTQPDKPVVISQEAQAMLDGFSEADWDIFIHRARAEGVAPLMYYALSRSVYPMPPVVRQKLQIDHYKAAALNQMILAEAGQVAKALNDANIPVIVLKGATLATLIYPDAALRPMNDLDLLTAAPYVGRVVKWLRSRQYDLLKITNHAVLQSQSPAKIRIELHWVLDGNHPISNQSEASLIQCVAREPETSNLWLSFTLLYICAHLVIKHSEGRLIWYFDIYSFLRKYQNQLDWKSLIHLAQQLCWTPVLEIALRGINQRFGYQHPENIQAEITGAAQNIKPSDLKIESVQSLMTRAFFALGFFDRLMMAFYFLFPAPRYLRSIYRLDRSKSLPFLYIYRLRDLVKGDVDHG